MVWTGCMLIAQLQPKEVLWIGGKNLRKQLYLCLMNCIIRFKDGKESQRSIDLNSQPDYREKLEVELKELRESEMWQAGAAVRKLRPENK